MFSFLLKKAGIWFAKKQEGPQQAVPEKSDEALPKTLVEVIAVVKKKMTDSSDVIIRSFHIGGNAGVDAALLYIDGLTDAKIINEDIVKSLMIESKRETLQDKNSSVLETIKNTLLASGEVREVVTMNEALEGALSGDGVLFVEGVDTALVMNAKGWESRSVTEPASEAVIRGPRESFVENMRTNTALLRRRIKIPSLTFDVMTIGERTHTAVTIAYINGVAQPTVIEEVKKRLKGINTDSILESGYIEQYIEDSPGSIFATVGYTERPDVTAAKMLEGRVAILVDGTPFVLTVPFLLIESFQAAEDYYFRPYFMTLTRILRVVGYMITVFGPAFYVAVTTYHQELIPTSLLITMARAREGIPFPAFVESLIMLGTFEILREAGIRLPRPIGQALSIVGALVVGESAVSAGLIGAPMVIVVALTAMSGFLVPNQYDAAVILRMIMLVLAATFGGFGIIVGIIGIFIHASSLESFGYPYLSPISPFDFDDSKDAVVRAPLWMMLSRPKGFSRDRQRKKYEIPPDGTNNSEGTSNE